MLPLFLLFFVKAVPLCAVSPVPDVPAVACPSLSGLSSVAAMLPMRMQRFFMACKNGPDKQKCCYPYAKLY